MNRPTMQDMKSLVKNCQVPCLSLYMPYIASGNETEQNEIRLKNLLQDAEKRLSKRGLRPKEVSAFLEPGFDVLEAERNTNQSGRGMALYIDSRSCTTWRLPVSFDSLLVDGTQFHIRPLLPYFFFGGDYLLLAITLNQARLYRGTRFELIRIDIPDLPKGIQDTLKYDEYEKQLQFHPGPAGSFHGHDVAHEDYRSNIRRYCEDIDRSVMDSIRETDKPLVIMAEDYVQAEFGRITRYLGAKIETNPKNPDALTEEEILEHALAPVDELLSAPLETAVRSYKRLAGTGKTSTHPEEVLRAAAEGRVQTMILNGSEYVWGRFDVKHGRLEAHASQRPGDDELFDIAAAYTLLNGGEVFPAEKKTIPDAPQVAAVFRY